MLEAEKNRRADELSSILECGRRTVYVEGYCLEVPPRPLTEDNSYAFWKRFADIVISATAILVFLPIIGLAAILIWLEDRGPVVYYQTRVGRCGEGFRFYKLRSMNIHADKQKSALKEQNEAEGTHFKIKRDPRITRVGRWLRKFSIDELPQLFCILRGQMSVVGPRPHLPLEVAAYLPGQEQRLLVKPGLLCFREVTGRSVLSFEEWVESDIQYLQSRSLKTDFMIFVRAFPAVISGRGAY